MKKYENLLKPIKVGNMELKNRMTFAPTYSFLADYDNHIGRRLIEWMRPLEAGGASLVVLGTGFPDKVMPDIAHFLPWLGDDSCINGMSELFDTIRYVEKERTGRGRDKNERTRHSGDAGQ